MQHNEASSPVASAARGPLCALAAFALACAGAVAAPPQSAPTPVPGAAALPGSGAQLPEMRFMHPRADQVERGRYIGSVEHEHWRSELRLGQIRARLEQFFGSLQGREIAPRQIESLFAPGFTGSSIAGSRRTHAERIGLEVHEWHVGEPVPREDFATEWSRYAQGFSRVRRKEYHVTRHDPLPPEPGEDARARVRVEFRLTGEAGESLREDQGVLEAVYVAPAAHPAAWRLARLELLELRTLRGRRWFTVTDDSLAGERPTVLDSLLVRGFTKGLSLADVDGDGDLDLFAPRRWDPASLYQNDGTGRFREITAEAGLAGLDEARAGYFFDADNDGDSDALVLTSRRMHFFENRDGRFTDVSERSGFHYMRTDGLSGAGVADYDGDGRLDFYVVNYGDPRQGPELAYFDAANGYFNKLFRNEGGLVFADETGPAGLDVDNTRWSFSALWADVDDDGAPDLYVVNDYGPNQLFRNRGDGTFEDVTAAAGVTDAGTGMGVSWGDVDNDGRMDLYVSNMRSYAGERLAHAQEFPGDEAAREQVRHFAKGNTMLRNVGGGHFEEVEASGAVDAKWAWGSAFTDYDNDGDLDLYVTNGFFSNLSVAETDPDFWRHVLVPISMGDARMKEGIFHLYDRLTIELSSYAGYERNRLFHNLGGGHLIDAAAVTGTDLVQDGRGVAAGDLDGDGDQDLVVSNVNTPLMIVLRNDVPNAGHYLAVETIGTRSNRQGIGARITLHCGERAQVRAVHLGGGYGTQSDLVAWFGLGACATVDVLEVRWPSGARQVLTDLPANRRITVTEPERRATARRRAEAG